MKYKKRITALMLTVIVCLALFACNKTQDDTAVTTDKEKETAARHSLRLAKRAIRESP